MIPPQIKQDDVAPRVRPHIELAAKNGRVIRRQLALPKRPGAWQRFLAWLDEQLRGVGTGDWR